MMKTLAIGIGTPTKQMLPTRKLAANLVMRRKMRYKKTKFHF
jgi:hypothetical protein